MLFTVSTVRDCATNARRFVAGNLAGGADHVVVLLDDPDADDQRDVRAFLEQHEHVTCIAADDDFWAGDRPRQLNVRQRIGANLVKHVLTDVPEAEWLFHLDGDEVLQVDRDVLSTVPDDAPAVHLEVLETASQWHLDGEPRLFKHLLGQGDLDLLQVLGLIPVADNGRYFHGHVVGKSGIRPRACGWLTLHAAVDAARDPLPRFTHPTLRMLHLDSYSGEEFCRKWLAMLGSGPGVHHRPARGGVASVLRALVAKDLPPEVTEQYLRRIWELSTADDVQTLTDLGLLTDIDVLGGSHVPARLPASAADAVRAGLDAVWGAPKRRFQNARAEAVSEAETTDAVERSRRRAWLRRD